LYGIPTTKATETSNKLGVSGFIDQWPQVRWHLCIRFLVSNRQSEDRRFKILLGQICHWCYINYQLYPPNFGWWLGSTKC
jgi:hypothetical protein